MDSQLQMIESKINHSNIDSPSDFRTDMIGYESTDNDFYWNILKTKTDFLNNEIKFKRTNAVQQSYNKFMKANSHLNLTESIMKNELNIDNVNNFGVENYFTLSKNTFPYDLGQHIHYVLWIHPKCTSYIKKKIFTLSGINSIINNLLLDNDNLKHRDRVIFRNCSDNKSVHTIEHFHVIFK